MELVETGKGYILHMAVNVTKSNALVLCKIARVANKQPCRDVKKQLKLPPLFTECAFNSFPLVCLYFAHTHKQPT